MTLSFSSMLKWNFIIKILHCFHSHFIGFKAKSHEKINVSPLEQNQTHDKYFWTNKHNVQQFYELFLKTLYSFFCSLKSLENNYNLTFLEEKRPGCLFSFQIVTTTKKFG